ncbi:lipoprotein insertase outer membrane protein LolB [Methyloversatilis thermotolerans]|uniref:lipoprotein insertase outer membrane protein LolB n=1 Tax=Methyloversatilis thermotolerans TaxID=1346290 RepID=UPI00035CF393|nr:lipoprotein insertase outer membrane protein LolB [Methyloversatilis thermotolerans]
MSALWSTARGAVLVSAIALTGCASVPSPDAQDAHALERRARQGEDAAFSLSARFVVRGPERTASAAMDWLHTRERDELQINGPLGKVLARLVRDDHGVRLVDDRQRVVEAASLDALSSELFGVRLPLSRAAIWVTGQAGTADVRARDAQGRVAVLTEGGWRVEFAEYASAEADALPQQIDASDGEHSFRLRIDAWHPVP